MRHISTGMQSILRLHSGDSLIEAVERALHETYARSAIVQFGIGSVEKAEFGTLPSEGPHIRHRVEGPHELVYLSGLVVGQASGGPYSSHLHIALADLEGNVRGGHLFSATVGAVAEVGLSPLSDTRLKRVRDEKRGLDLLDL